MPNTIQHIDLGSATERADGVLFTILELVAEGTKAEIGEEKAKQLAFDVVNTVRGTFGGELVYVCKVVLLMQSCVAVIFGLSFVEITMLSCLKNTAVPYNGFIRWSVQ